MSENLYKLQDEISLGGRAQNAYDLYVKQHIEKIRTQIFESFSSADISDEEVLKLKRLAMAINGLETSILSDIEGAKIATIQLNKLNKN